MPRRKAGPSNLEMYLQRPAEQKHLRFNEWCRLHGYGTRGNPRKVEEQA